jgi:hypothetical protein
VYSLLVPCRSSSQTCVPMQDPCRRPHQVKMAAMGRGLARLLATAAGAPKKTALHAFHVRHGGKLVPFAGWEMPVQYADQGMIASHHHTRKAASLFDVSHMLQFKCVPPSGRCKHPHIPLRTHAPTIG